MVVVYCYKGRMNKVSLRKDIINRYNEYIKSHRDVRLYYDNGVPYLEGGKEISITHTDIGQGERIELVAIGDTKVGIDIESLKRVPKYDVENRFFSEAERRYIDGDNARFIEIWCKREAYGKSIKVGMYTDDVTSIEGFRTYNLYDGYCVMLYSEEDDVVFVAM